MVTYFDFRRNEKNSGDFLQVECHQKTGTKAGLVSPATRYSGRKSTTDVDKRPQGEEA
jgi:hypothetical protein